MPMARKAKIIKPRRVSAPVVPANTSWFESDSYDRRTRNEIVADAPSLADLAETGERLVPHFGALVQDLFFALFKMNPVFRKSGDVRLAAALNASATPRSRGLPLSARASCLSRPTIRASPPSFLLLARR